MASGGFWQAIEAWGVLARNPKQAYTAFEEALHIIKGLWAHPAKPFSYEGEFYRVKGALFGPAPVHPIRIWVGGLGPKMQRLTGKMADGLIVSNSYTTPAQLLDFNRNIDEGAAEAGRSPDEIRRGYNVMGVINSGRYAARPTGLSENAFYGSAREWADYLIGLNRNQRVDTFIFWGIGDDYPTQLETFADEVMPMVREAVRM